MANAEPAQVLRFGPFEVDLVNRQLLKKGLSVRLQGQPFDVLAMLLERPGQLVTREQLRTRLWPTGTIVEFDHSIHAAVTRLREALDEHAEHPRYIATVPRHGYRFIAPVSTLASAALEVTAARPQLSRASASEDAPERPGFSDHPRRHAPGPNTDINAARISSNDQSALPLPPRAVRPFDPRLPAVIIGAALVLGYVVADKFWISRHSTAEEPASPRVQQALAPTVDSAAPIAFNPPPRSIAVLPLANESGDASQQYFSDGLSEDLITALSQFPGLKVIGRTSSFQFRDSKEDSRSIGTKLGVSHLLEGSVRRSGEVVRVSAALIDTSDGSTQWSERYDRPYKDLFALQDEITRAVAGALRAKLLSGEHAAAQSDRPPGGSLEAYNALLQGRFHAHRGTVTDTRKAIEYYAQAIKLDPRYALAWSMLSRSRTNLVLLGASSQETYAKAREAADRALALSPELPAAHLAEGYVLQRAYLDWRGAEAEYRRALALAANDGDGEYHLANLLATFGEVEPAIELTRQALVTEPLRADWYNWLAIYLTGLHRLDEAELAVRKAIELQPAAPDYHQRLAIIEILRGHAQAALMAAQQEPPGYWRDVALALARQIGGDRSAADAALGTLIEKDPDTATYQIAEVYALRNDANATFKWLDRAWNIRDAGITYLLFDPFILRYKGDPRFAAFCQKVGLPVPGEVRVGRDLLS